MVLVGFPIHCPPSPSEPFVALEEPPAEMGGVCFVLSPCIHSAAFIKAKVLRVGKELKRIKVRMTFLFFLSC